MISAIYKTKDIHFICHRTNLKCKDCKIIKQGKDPDLMIFIEEGIISKDFTLPTINEALKHFDHHIRLGHVVPQELFKKLKKLKAYENKFNSFSKELSKMIFSINSSPITTLSCSFEIPDTSKKDSTEEVNDIGNIFNITFDDITTKDNNE